MTHVVLQETQLLTYVGFWPMREMHGAIDLEIYDGFPTEPCKKKLREPLLAERGVGWSYIVCKDYLNLLHLESCEPALVSERESLNNDEFISFSLTATRFAWKQYLEALNALYFLIFAACRTGRNHLCLPDFAELSIWNCSRLMYDQNGIPHRHAHYGRSTGSYLRRFGLQKFERSETLIPLEEGIFQDAAAYWSTVFDAKLLPLAALGTKIITEHRIANYRVAVALTWFELEAWIYQRSQALGYPRQARRKNGQLKDRTVYELLEDFPKGSTIANIRDDLHAVRKKRNDIAHENLPANRDDSELALKCFLTMFSQRSGLKLEIDMNEPPTLGL